MDSEYELCTGWKARSRPAFNSQEEYDAFREEFARSVKPAFEKYALARARSEEAARYHFIKF